MPYVKVLCYIHILILRRYVYTKCTPFCMNVKIIFIWKGDFFVGKGCSKRIFI